MPEENISGVVLTFFSTASSVGKTLISVNMASELARQGYRVCLADYDLQFGDVCNYLKLPFERSVKDIIDVMKRNPDASLKDQLTKYRYGTVSFDVVPSPELMEDAYNVAVEDCKKLIERLRLMRLCDCGHHQHVQRAEPGHAGFEYHRYLSGGCGFHSDYQEHENRQRYRQDTEL